MQVQNNKKRPVGGPNCVYGLLRGDTKGNMITHMQSKGVQCVDNR